MSRSEIKKGSLVELIRLSRWGGRIPTGRLGVVIRRSYLAYEVDDCKWEVLVKGEVMTVERKQLRPHM